jgi:hypothetical protein
MAFEARRVKRRPWVGLPKPKPMTREWTPFELVALPPTEQGRLDANGPPALIWQNAIYRVIARRHSASSCTLEVRRRDQAPVESITDLVRISGALAGVDASASMILPREMKPQGGALLHVRKPEELATWG